MLKGRWPFKKQAAHAIEDPDIDPATLTGHTFNLRNKRIVSIGPFDIFVMPDDYIGQSIVKQRRYEPHVTILLAELLQEESVFLDIGANIGFFTLLASRKLTRGKVISFEPNAQNLQLLYSSLLLNDCTNVTVFPYAASDAEQLLRFRTIGSNGLVLSKNAALNDDEIIVPAVRIDRLLAAEPKIDIIKIDVEGHEFAVMRGMSKLIQRHRPLILTEIFPLLMRQYGIDEPLRYLEFLHGELGYSFSVVTESSEMIEAETPAAVLAYWSSLARDQAHLDLYARPK